MASQGGDAYLIGILLAGVNVEVPASAFALSGRRLHGVRIGSSNIAADFPRFVDLYQKGRLMLDELVAERISLAEVNGRIRDDAQRRTGPFGDRLPFDKAVGIVTSRDEQTCEDTTLTVWWSADSGLQSECRVEIEWRTDHDDEVCGAGGDEVVGPGQLFV